MSDWARVRAGNPSPMTLDGTNTWVLGRDPCWVVDPGPLLDAHVAAIVAEAEARGGAAGVALTHDHADHSQAAPAVAAALGGVPVAAMRWRSDEVETVALADGGTFGPLQAVAVPGHASDHLALVFGRACCTGDAVLGAGSVFVQEDLGGYLDGLRRLLGLELEVLLPGHGPPVENPAAKLDEYIAHRLDRERRLVDALGRGLRSVDELLDDVWDDAPAILRPAAALTLGAHLDKLQSEGRLPDGVQWPERR